MGLFDDRETAPGSSGLFGPPEAEDPHATPHLDDSPEDLDGSRKFRGLIQIASAAFVLVALLVASIYVFGRNGSNSEPASGTSPIEANTTGNTDPESASSLEEALGSVVLIAVGTRAEFCATGSGFAVGDGSIIVTNDHVIESSQSCPVDFIGIFVSSDPSSEPEPTFIGEVLSKDPITDLALLSITDQSGEPGRLRPLELSTEPVEVGETLQIIGYPGIGGFTVTVTRGSVAGFTNDETGRWIKTDASMSGGNSGGAAINAAGKVVGVPTQAGGGGAEIVDCREFDTNNDGVIDQQDSCVPIGGFLNRLRPSDYVIQMIRQAS